MIAGLSNLVYSAVNSAHMARQMGHMQSGKTPEQNSDDQSVTPSNSTGFSSEALSALEAYEINTPPVNTKENSSGANYHQQQAMNSYQQAVERQSLPFSGLIA